MIDACPDSAVLFFDVDGTLTSFDPDNMTDKDFSAVRPSQAVIEAFFYWEKQGLIRVVGEDPVQIRYLTLRQHAVSSAPSPVMEYAEHVAALNSVFTARTLSSTELRHMLDWVEVFGMDKDAMAAVAEYCVAMKGQKVSVNYMDAVAKSWAEAGILTKEKAMELSLIHI